MLTCLAKLPCNCGASLDTVEGEEAVQQIINSLVNLASDSLDTIVFQLAAHMDRMLKVCISSYQSRSSLTLRYHHRTNR